MTIQVIGAGFGRTGTDSMREALDMQLSNIGRLPVLLYPAVRVCQIVLQQLSSPAERPYGADRGSGYNAQSGPQVSRLRLDEHS